MTLGCAVLATVGVVISTGIIAVLMWLAFNAFHIQFPFISCLLFSALISPTDPVAALAIPTGISVPKGLK